MKLFRIATYNVHKCRGLDGRVRPERIAAILEAIDAQFVCLQEVLEPQAELIARKLDYRYVFGATRKHLGHGYGNVTLSRRPFEQTLYYDLTIPGFEERGCLRTDVRVGKRLLHIFNLHLGTAFLERRRQAQKLVDQAVLKAIDISGARVVLGDFNEWTRGSVTRALRTEFHQTDLRVHLSRLRTYPAVFPVLHLDHIYFDWHLEAERASFFMSKNTLIASDHLPLVAEFRFKRET